MKRTCQIFTSLSICLLVFLVPYVQGASGTSDLSPGMSLEHAILVAKQCVIAAADFKDPRPTRPDKELRPQDTLAFAGITDKDRLAVLRRFIIRNYTLGVQSVWAVRLNENEPRPYLIGREELKDMTTDWTIAQLAKAISEKSGLPFLTRAAVATVSANCRKLVGGVPHTDANGKEIGVPKDRRIFGDVKVANFQRCMEGDDNALDLKNHGIRSLSITDGAGDEFPYTYNRVDCSIPNNPSYGQLIECIAKKAAPDFSAEVGELIIQIIALRSLTTVEPYRSKLQADSFVITGTCAACVGLNSATTLQMLGISKANFAASLGNPAIRRFTKGRGKTWQADPAANSVPFEATTPVWQILDDRIKKAEEGK